MLKFMSYDINTNNNVLISLAVASAFAYAKEDATTNDFNIAYVVLKLLNKNRSAGFRLYLFYAMKGTLRNPAGLFLQKCFFKR